MLRSFCISNASSYNYNIVNSIFYLLTTGITCVTPSPLSTTIPVKVLSSIVLEAQLAAKARTACTAIYNPGTLNDSNMISAVYSLFSGVFNGGSVKRK